MLYTSLAFLAGICALQFYSSLPAAGWWWLLACLPLSLHPAAPFRLTGVAIAGFLWAWWHAGQLLAIELPANLEGRDLLVRGVIEGLPEQLGNDKVRFRFQLDSYRDKGNWHKLKIDTRLTWYRQAAWPISTQSTITSSVPPTSSPSRRAPASWPRLWTRTSTAATGARLTGSG